jgi:hypothetical protein
MHYQADDEQNQEDHEQDLGYTGKRDCDPAEAKDGGHQRDDEKRYCVVEHFYLRLNESRFVANLSTGCVPVVNGAKAAVGLKAKKTPKSAFLTGERACLTRAKLRQGN